MRQFDYVMDMMGMALQDLHTLRIKGRVVQVVGTIVKAVVPHVKVGEVCILRNPDDGFEIKAEVVGLAKDSALLTPLGDMTGISGSTEVIPTGQTHMVPVGWGLLLLACPPALFNPAYRAIVAATRGLRDRYKARAHGTG